MLIYANGNTVSGGFATENYPGGVGWAGVFRGEEYDYVTGPKKWKVTMTGWPDNLNSWNASFLVFANLTSSDDTWSNWANLINNLTLDYANGDMSADLGSESTEWDSASNFNSASAATLDLVHGDLQPLCAVHDQH